MQIQRGQAALSQWWVRHVRSKRWLASRQGGLRDGMGQMTNMSVFLFNSRKSGCRMLAHSRIWCEHVSFSQYWRPVTLKEKNLSSHVKNNLPCAWLIWLNPDYWLHWSIKVNKKRLNYMMTVKYSTIWLIPITFLHHCAVSLLVWSHCIHEGVIRCNVYLSQSLRCEGGSAVMFVTEGRGGLIRGLCSFSAYARPPKENRQ